jgi:hypothetical protein
MSGFQEATTDQSTCAICFEDISTSSAHLPCCSTKIKDPSTPSSTQFCLKCISTICNMDGLGIGRCPRCRHYIRVGTKEGKPVIEKVSGNLGQCRMCRGTKELVQNGMCDACLFGSRHAFRYECDKCHRYQRIPHPMYRYQSSPEAFSSATWACHLNRGCEYTHWRISKHDLGNVPWADIPEAWDMQESQFETIRNMRGGVTGGCHVM